ncbi:hypothetical protein [Arcobacter caeni]|uniref:Uncharacterized protein n=1 Tax=Arcobacter caeni TaxID=1912877 RepID=A0A363D3X0_9BACT|nr:hypothetical protein [Arcobacter caeni]PUE65999.1 hypothetical protein B0174_01655 [Arcobacter caeni]
MHIIMTLAFTSVLLVFMIYPAIKIVGFLETKMEISDRMYSILTVSITIVLALIVGAGLYFI